MATDGYGQGITIPALTDSPSISTVGASLESLLSHSVLRFSSASARAATLVGEYAPTEGMISWLTDVDRFDYYDGAAWVAMDPPQCQVGTSSFSLPSQPSLYTAVTFTSQVSSNRSGMWSSGSPTRIVLPTPGTYAVQGVVNWSIDLGTSTGRAEFRLNGVTQAAARYSVTDGSNGNHVATASGWVIASAAGDYVEVFANQSTGSAVPIAVYAGVHRISTATA